MTLGTRNGHVAFRPRVGSRVSRPVLDTRGCDRHLTVTTAKGSTPVATQTESGPKNTLQMSFDCHPWVVLTAHPHNGSSSGATQMLHPVTHGGKSTPGSCSRFSRTNRPGCTIRSRNRLHQSRRRRPHCRCDCPGKVRECRGLPPCIGCWNCSMTHRSRRDIPHPGRCKRNGCTDRSHRSLLAMVCKLRVRKNRQSASNHRRSRVRRNPRRGCNNACLRKHRRRCNMFDPRHRNSRHCRCDCRDSWPVCKSRSAGIGRRMCNSSGRDPQDRSRYRIDR